MSSYRAHLSLVAFMLPVAEMLDSWPLIRMCYPVTRIIDCSFVRMDAPVRWMRQFEAMGCSELTIVSDNESLSSHFPASIAFRPR